MSNSELPSADTFARLGRVSWFGFLGFLGALGFLGFIPGCERLFGLAGLSGLFGLFGFSGFFSVAQRIELARRREQAGSSQDDRSASGSGRIVK